MKCTKCRQRAVVALPSHHAGFCPECFLEFFRNQVIRAIRKWKMFTHDDNILIALSGGKDSLSLARQLKDLDYKVTGLHIDLGIEGSSPSARAKTEQFCSAFSIPLHVVETASHGLPIPLVKKIIRRPVCSVCGSIKRSFFNRFALENGYDVLATGHNLNDEVSRLFSNVLTWDTAYLADQGPILSSRKGFARKVKPLYRLTEFETANFCFLSGIDYGYEPCPYSKGATFSFYKTLWDELEYKQPGRRRHFYEAFLERGRPNFQQYQEEEETILRDCPSCGYPTSAEICQVCTIQKRVAEARQKAGEQQGRPYGS